MILCKYYFNTELLKTVNGYELYVLEAVNRFLDDDGISVQLPINNICYNRKVLIRRYREAIKRLESENVLIDWKIILNNFSHINVPDDFYLVNPNYIRHINKTKFKEYLKYTERRILDTTKKFTVNKYWAVHLIPNYAGDEFGGIYTDSYTVTTESDERKHTNKSILSF